MRVNTKAGCGASVSTDVGVPVGDGEYVPPATFILMCGYLLYEAKKADGDARAYARQLLDGVLAASSAAGFRRGDLLETLMSRAERTDRLRDLAREAAAAIGDTTAFLCVLRAAGANLGTGE